MTSIGSSKGTNRKLRSCEPVSGYATYQEFVELIGSEIACTALAQLIITVLGEFGVSFVGDGSVRVVL